MSDDNAKNVIYFESSTMKGLYQEIVDWQTRNCKRMLSLEIKKDGDMFCCIGLTNPSEVIICSGSGGFKATVTNGALKTH